MNMAAQNNSAAERRAFAEFRTDNTARKLHGYAAIFGSEARLGSFVETIEPGAFRASLDRDILALMDHDQSRILGRTKSKTLQLSEDSKGLAFSLDVPDTQTGNDVLSLASRGDLGGMSFGFVVPEGGESWKDNKRSLRNVNLFEISIVSAFPAYPDTTLALRNRPADDERSLRARQVLVAEAML